MNTQSHFMSRVFVWMTVALAITGVIAGYIGMQPLLMMRIFSSSWRLWGIIIAQLVVAGIFASMLPRLAYATALLLFLGYSTLTGLTFSLFFYAYDVESLVRALFITAGMFGSMALYGFITRADLSSLRSMLFMGLWGVILASLINIFMGSSTFSLVISWLSVLVFCGLTAYDVDMLKRYAQVADQYDGQSGKVALYGAFNLYLDFINLFIAILNITGKRKK